VVEEVGKTARVCEFRYVSNAQLEKLQSLIFKGIDEGAELIAGGPGCLEAIRRGYS
jgi:hypothetical protein